jgi:hypothetical protein
LSSGLLTQVERQPATTAEHVIQTARYHREQAELCLEMARSMSDRQAADMLCTVAARHFAEALEVEKQARLVGNPTTVGMAAIPASALSLSSRAWEN